MVQEKARKLAIASIASMITTIIVGGLVKAHGAGMACGPDWPHCNGEILPSNILTDTGVFLEYIHRVVGGVSFILLSAAVYYASKLGDGKLTLTAVSALLALIIQVLLGMVVVQSFLNQYIVAAHLSLAMISIVAATILAVRLGFTGDRRC